MRIIKLIHKFNKEIEKSEVDTFIKKKNKLDDISKIESEMDRLLEKVTPTFLLAPGALEAFICVVKDNSLNNYQRTELGDELARTLVDFYQNNFKIFMKLLEKKGVKVKRNKSIICKVFIDKIDKKNYIDCLNKYGDLIPEGEHINISTASHMYLKSIGVENIEFASNLHFLSKLFFDKQITSYRWNLKKISKKIDEVIEEYKLEQQITKLEQRLESEDISGDNKRISLRHIDNMTGIEFEKFLSELFNRLGYKIEETKVSGDQGADLLVYKDNECIAIQSKCYSSKVGNKAVQEVVSGGNYYKAEKHMVVTNNYFTRAANDLAKKTNTILWDRDYLSNLIDLLY
ncbi:restriction endonuclease [Virgibacillus sp. L01]|uniref:restriction endonuclease n=1 Tax=Virgibacillus sp. L01 TaxID=3457429 RepID=UPI003FD6A50B